MDVVHLDQKQLATRWAVSEATLAPDIVAAMLDESLPDHVTLFDLASGTPLLREDQRAFLRP